jgi:hypothetical protein
MVKKSLDIVLALLVLVATTGIMVTKHYCGDNLAGIAFFSKPEPCCDMEGCCHFESSFHQLKEDFFTPDNYTKSYLQWQDMFSVDFVAVAIYGPESHAGAIFPVAEPPPLLVNSSCLSFIQSYRC